MAKIAKVKDDKVMIVHEDGSMEELTVERFNFDPEVGVEVDIYKSESEILIEKKKE